MILAIAALAFVVVALAHHAARVEADLDATRTHLHAATDAHDDALDQLQRVENQLADTRHSLRETRYALSHSLTGSPDDAWAVIGEWIDRS